jgi:UDP-glucose 4-epimerase
MLLQSSAVRRILVTGGAGYIGSHTVRLLRSQGYDVTVVDNLCRGHRDTVPADCLHVLDVRDTDALTALLGQAGCEAVIHFAAYIAVGESMQSPEMYFANNAGGSLSLLTAMVRAGVRHLVFSSTAGVYGIPQGFPIVEDFPIQPVNPYGESKAMVEKMLGWFDRIHGLRSAALRYFNAAGAAPGGEIGEAHDPETHLIPLLFRAIFTGRPITIFGDDYPTPDGTCIRDYIHVDDLAQAHIRALAGMAAGAPTDQFNVGTGTGHSVRQVVAAVEEVTGRKVPYVIGPRREGDPPGLVANPDKLRRVLGWEPRYTSLREIVSTAWNYAVKHPPPAFETEPRR